LFDLVENALNLLVGLTKSDNNLSQSVIINFKDYVVVIVNRQVTHNALPDKYRPTEHHQDSLGIVSNKASQEHPIRRPHANNKQHTPDQT
jgi:hypothetical protein